MDAHLVSARLRRATDRVYGASPLQRFLTAQSLVSGPQRTKWPAFEMRLDTNGAHMPLYEHVMIARQDLSNTQAEGLDRTFWHRTFRQRRYTRGHEYWGVKTMAYKINKNRKGPLRLFALRRTGTCRAGNGTPDASCMMT